MIECSIRIRSNNSFRTCIFYSNLKWWWLNKVCRIIACKLSLNNHIVCSNLRIHIRVNSNRGSPSRSEWNNELILRQRGISVNETSRLILKCVDYSKLWEWSCCWLCECIYGLRAWARIEVVIDIGLSTRWNRHLIY